MTHQSDDNARCH